MKGKTIVSMMGAMGTVMAKTFEKDLPKAEYKTCEIRELDIPMSDGVKLHAIVSSPDFSKPLPVILIRNPYIMYDWMRNIYHIPFAKHGYVFIHVKVRGTFSSEGEFVPFENDIKDGHDTLDWITEQPWCDGNIGMIGASYSGYTQWAVADYHKPALKGMFLSVAGAEGYDVFYHRGLFNEEVWGEWAAQQMGDNKDEMWAGPSGAKLREKAFAANPPIEIGEAVIGEHCDFFDTWASNWKGDEPYWTKGFWKDFRNQAEELDVPVFLHAGWWDIFEHVQMSSWKRMKPATKDKSILMVGPWSHSGLAGGDLKYPGEGNCGFLQIPIAIKWFDHIIKGKDFDYEEGHIYAYNIGNMEWEKLGRDFEADDTLTFYLDASDKKKKAYQVTSKEPKKAEVSYKYDPKKPVPSRGGRLIASHNGGLGLTPECSCEQEPVGKRKDVISFVSEAFRKDTKILGSIEATLYVSSDAPATAFTIKISEVMEDGKTYNIRDDYTDIRWLDNNTYKEYKPGKVRELNFEMTEISWTLKKGSKLRIDISSSSNPQFLPHKNTTEPWAYAKKSEVARQTLYTGGKQASKIVLPIQK